MGGGYGYVSCFLYPFRCDDMMFLFFNKKKAVRNRGMSSTAGYSVRDLPKRFRWLFLFWNLSMKFPSVRWCVFVAFLSYIVYLSLKSLVDFWGVSIHGTRWKMRKESRKKCNLLVCVVGGVLGENKSTKNTNLRRNCSQISFCSDFFLLLSFKLWCEVLFDLNDSDTLFGTVYVFQIVKCS